MKRILIGALAALFSVASFAASTYPLQLMNPAGSTTGQAAVSTGPTTPPAWGNVTAAALAPQAANTVVANVTGSSAQPTAVAVPSCSAANSAIKYTSAAGWGCGTTYALTSGNLAQFSTTTSAQLAGIISDETGTGSLVLGTSPTITTPTINGVTNGANGGAGVVGQCVTSGTVGPVTMTTSGAIQNITSVALSAGDWLVNASIVFQTTGTISGTSAGISTTSTTQAPAPYYFGSSATLNAGASSAGAIPMQRISPTASTTYYLNAVENFTVGGTVTAQMIACRWH